MLYWLCLTFMQSYDYTLEKVKMYTCVPLGDVTEITKGSQYSFLTIIHINMM
jgi:hypothetical protein